MIIRTNDLETDFSDFIDELDKFLGKFDLVSLDVIPDSSLWSSFLQDEVRSWLPPIETLKCPPALTESA